MGPEDATATFVGEDCSGTSGHTRPSQPGEVVCEGERRAYPAQPRDQGGVALAGERAAVVGANIRECSRHDLQRLGGDRPLEMARDEAWRTSWPGKPGWLSWPMESIILFA